MGRTTPPNAGRGETGDRLKALLNRMEKVAVQAYRADGTITFWNKASEKLYGFTAAEIVGKDIHEWLLEPSARDEQRRLTAEAVRTGQAPPSGGVEARRKDGSACWVYANRIMVSEAGRETEFFCFEIDITERKRAEEALRESEKKYRSIVETTSEWIWEMDRDGRHTYSNPAMTAIMGYRPEEFLGQDALSFLHPDDQRHVKASLAQLIAEKRGWREWILRWRHKNGAYRYLESNATPLIDGAGELIGYIGVDRDITERKHAEEALWQNQVELQCVLDTTADGILAIDNHGKVIKANQRFMDLWRIPPALMDTGDDQKLLDFVLGQLSDPEAFLSKVQVLYQSVDEDFDTLTFKDGRVYERYSSPMMAGTSIIGRVWSFRDVTDRKRAADALRESETRWQFALEGPGDGVWDWNTVTNRVYFSPRWKAMLGYAEHEIGDTLDEWDRRVHPDDKPGAYADLERHFRRETAVYQNEHRLLCKDGSYKWILDRGKVIEWSQDGKPVRVIGVHTDITERKHAEKALRDTWALYHRMVQNSPMGMHFYELREDNRLIFCGGNPAADLLTGTNSNSLIGKDIVEAFPPLANTEVPERYRQAARHGIAWTSEVDFQYGDVSGAYQVHAYQTAPNEMVAVFMDIADRRRADAQRESLEAQLRQSQKMEAVGQLAGGVAHDFNNMLQVILGHLELVQEDLPPDAPQGEALEAVRKAAERASDLTRQLLAFSRRQIIQPSGLDLNELIDGLLRMIRRVIGEHIDLCYEPGEKLDIIRADKGQIEQILMNLCVNARDAMPTGGMLTIRTKNAFLDDAYCRANPWASTGKFVWLSVTDTGCGMDEATLKQAFEPFFTTKEVGQGTGLGLSMVYGVVKQHDGLVHASSTPGAGSTFSVYLPSVEQTAEAASPPAEIPVAGGTETILIAEDEEAVRNLVARMLRTAGYAVLTAGSGDEALRLFESHANGIDLAVLDVVMPGLSGRDVMDRIQIRSPRTRFLFSSGYSEDAIHSSFVINEGLRLIAKPYKKMELLRIVREILDEHPPL